MSALEKYVDHHVITRDGAAPPADRDSIGGVLIFSAIGLAVSILAALFSWLDLPPPAF